MAYKCKFDIYNKIIMLALRSLVKILQVTVTKYIVLKNCIKLKNNQKLATKFNNIFLRNQIIYEK